MFKALREACYLSQSECAEWMDVNKRTVQSWESGREPLPAPRLEAIKQLRADMDAYLIEAGKALSQFAGNERKRLLIYSNRDYELVNWGDGDKWPTAGVHRALMGCLVSLVENIELVWFNYDDYIQFKGNRPDDTTVRAEWLISYVGALKK